MGISKRSHTRGKGKQVMWRVELHDDVIKWKYFPRYWPFVRGIHRLPVNSPHKGQWRGALMFSLICACMNDWVHSWGWWFETPSLPLWCHSNELALPDISSTISELDTNGCPLGNSKFILVSDNLNICLWLSACQVKKINQINNPWSTIY